MLLGTRGARQAWKQVSSALHIKKWVGRALILTMFAVALADLLHVAVATDREFAQVQLHEASVERYRFTPETLPAFQPCEKESLGMHPWKKLQSDAVMLCSGGISTIACLRRFTTSTKPRTYVCEFHDLVEILSPNGTLRWVAQCTMQDVNLTALFRTLQPVHPLNFLEVRQELGAQARLNPLSVLESLPAGVDFADHVRASLPWPSQQKSTTREGLTFLSTGDCTTGNPGHCQAQHTSG